MNTRKSLTATLNGVVQVTLHTPYQTYGGTELYPDTYKFSYIFIGRSIIFDALPKRFDRVELQRELQKEFGCFLQLDVDDGVHTVFCTVDRDERVVLAGVVYCFDNEVRIIEICKVVVEFDCDGAVELINGHAVEYCKAIGMFKAGAYLYRLNFKEAQYV